MSESQQKVYRRKRESYRLGQENRYRLSEPVKAKILKENMLFRFVEDYFHVRRDTVYRWLKSNDPALTQIGFLQELTVKINMVNAPGVPLVGFDCLIEKAN